jgi:hypothetical protein
MQYIVEGFFSSEEKTCPRRRKPVLGGENLSSEDYFPPQRIKSK